MTDTQRVILTVVAITYTVAMGVHDGHVARYLMVFVVSFIAGFTLARITAIKED